MCTAPPTNGHGNACVRTNLFHETGLNLVRGLVEAADELQVAVAYQAGCEIRLPHDVPLEHLIVRKAARRHGDGAASGGFNCGSLCAGRKRDGQQALQDTAALQLASREQSCRRVFAAVLAAGETLYSLSAGPQNSSMQVNMHSRHVCYIVEVCMLRKNDQVARACTVIHRSPQNSELATSWIRAVSAALADTIHPAQTTT